MKRVISNTGSFFLVDNENRKKRESKGEEKRGKGKGVEVCKQKAGYNNRQSGEGERRIRNNIGYVAAAGGWKKTCCQTRIRRRREPTSIVIAGLCVQKKFKCLSRCRHYGKGRRGRNETAVASGMRK